MSYLRTGLRRGVGLNCSVVRMNQSATVLHLDGYLSCLRLLKATYPIVGLCQSSPTLAFSKLTFMLEL
jgi:hypothetical protein